MLAIVFWIRNWIDNKEKTRLTFGVWFLVTSRSNEKNNSAQFEMSKRNPYLCCHFRQFFCVINEFIEIIGQIMWIVHIFNATCMNFVAYTFLRSKLASKGILAGGLVPFMLYWNIFWKMKHFVESFMLFSLDPLATKNQLPNTKCFVAVQIWKEKRQPGLFSFQYGTTTKNFG